MGLAIPDILFTIILLYFTVRGFLNGLIKEISRLGGLILSCYLASEYHEKLIPLIQQYFITEETAQVISFLILFFLIIIIIKFLSSFTQKFFEFVYLGWLNKLLGALLGFTKGLVVLSILIFCMYRGLPIKAINQ